MKLTSILAASLAVFSVALLSSCASTKKTVRIKPEPFAKTQIVVDGDDLDWPSPYPFYDSKALISYASSNDSSNLYLTIKASDRKIMMKILKGGMKVFIDTSGGKDEYMSIQSPMPGNAPAKTEEEKIKNSGIYETDPTQHRDEGGRRKQMMLGAEQFDVSGFGNCDGHYATNEDAKQCGIQVKLGINDYNELVWEAKIPFTSWGHHLSPSDIRKPVNICFEIAALKSGGKTYGGGGKGSGTGGRGGGMGGGGGMHGGGMGGGGGMRGGGMRGGGMSRGGGGNRANQNMDEAEALSKTSRTYLKVVFANK